MVRLSAARRLALSLPEATEEDHHGMPSFRVRSKIFATVPDAQHLHVMLDEHLTYAAVSMNPCPVHHISHWRREAEGSRARCRRRAAFAVVMLFSATGCEVGKVATLDLRPLSAPVVLNGSPFLASAPKMTAADEGEYEGTVQESESDSGGAYGPYYYTPPSHSQEATNDVQLNASKALGGRPNSAIIDLAIDVRTLDLFLFAGYISEAEITAHGKVVDILEAAQGEAGTAAEDGNQ